MATVVAAILILSIASFSLASILAVFLFSDSAVFLPPPLKDVELSEIRGARQRAFLSTYSGILATMDFSMEMIATTPAIVGSGRIAFAWFRGASCAALLTVTPRHRSLSFLSEQDGHIIETTNESSLQTFRTRDGRPRRRCPDLADPVHLLAAHCKTIESNVARAPESLEVVLESSYRLAAEADVEAGLRTLTGRLATPTLKGRWRSGRSRLRSYLEALDVPSKPPDRDRSR